MVLLYPQSKVVLVTHKSSNPLSKKFATISFFLDTGKQKLGSANNSLNLSSYLDNLKK